MKVATGAPALQKKLGQHHLTRPEVARPLVEFLAPGGRRVVEIGPGGGILTGELLAAEARVLALELDPAWAFAVRQRLPAKALTVVATDALSFDWSRLPGGTLAAGNLPYNVATALIERLLPHHAAIPKAAFLVQLEVAERLAAMPGSDAYGALSVLTQARAVVEILGRVRPGAFHPPPKVDSAFVGLRLKSPPLPEAAMPAFTRLVHLAFGQRRKTLRNALAAGLGRERAEAVLSAAGIETGARAEELGLPAYVHLATVAGADP